MGPKRSASADWMTQYTYLPRCSVLPAGAAPREAVAAGRSCAMARSRTTRGVPALSPLPLARAGVFGPLSDGARLPRDRLFFFGMDGMTSYLPVFFGVRC